MQGLPLRDSLFAILAQDLPPSEAAARLTEDAGAVGVLGFVLIAVCIVFDSQTFLGKLFAGARLARPRTAWALRLRRLRLSTRSRLFGTVRPQRLTLEAFAFVRKRPLGRAAAEAPSSRPSSSPG
jgi:hypothetical protein